MLGLGLLRRGDRDQFDLGELVLADHAAGVLAGGARLGAEARRAGGEPHRQLHFVDDRLAHQIGERHFGGGDEPEAICLVLGYIGKLVHDGAERLIRKFHGRICIWPRTCA